MSYWYNIIEQIKNDWQPLIDCIDHFEQELETARKELKIHGSLEKNSADLPGIVEYRFRQYQEIEHILEYMNIRFNKEKNKSFRNYIENYNRSLSSRDAEKFAETDSNVYNMKLLVNRVALLRNQYLAIHNGLTAKQFQINNITKLKTAGLEDSEINY